jgi:hypothetical protein
MRSLGLVDPGGLGIIAMNEFAIQKGHRQATVIVEPAHKRVLCVGLECRRRLRAAVIERVRVDRANELRGDRRGGWVVRGVRRLLLKNRDSLGPGEDV